MRSDLATGQLHTPSLRSVATRRSTSDRVVTASMPQRPSMGFSNEPKARRIPEISRSSVSLNCSLPRLWQLSVVKGGREGEDLPGDSLHLDVIQAIGCILSLW